MSNVKKYTALYKISISLIADGEIINIPSSDIVSIMMVNNYDTMSFPIIRVRLYSDISIMQKIVEVPNDVYIRGNLDGAIYQMSDEDKSPTIVLPIKNIPFHMKVYIENKNIPTSSMDQYIEGVKKNSDLNENIKVPIELYCYNQSSIHNVRQKVPSIYKDISILSVIEDFFRRSDITEYHIDPSINQKKFDQILLPNLDVSQALSFFDHMYGLYPKGAQFYGDIDKLYLCDSDVDNGTTPIPIYVDSYKNNTDMSGMKRTTNGFYMETMAGNVSIISETDVERTLNTQNIAAVDLHDMHVDTAQMSNLYDIKGIDNESTKIETPNIIHKTKNEFIVSTRIARVDENVTRVDVSGVGFDISKLKINTRYNLIFESAMRGISMNKRYRATYVCNVLSNLDSNLFVAQTTMNLCNN